MLSTNSTRTNQNLLSSGQQPLSKKKKPADSSRYFSFNALTEPVAVWTPASQKCLYLTTVQLAAPLGVTITLSSDGNQQLLSFRLTQAAPSVSQTFPSGCRLSCGSSLLVRTSDEESDCETFGASTASQTAVNGRSDFTNVANAAGFADGQVATLNSALLTQTGGRIVLPYSIAIAALNQLQLTSVMLKFYCRLALTLAVGTSTMILYWRPNAAVDWTQLQQLSLSLIGTLNYLTTPLEQDITAAVLAADNPWEVITNLQTSFVGTHTGLGLGNTIQLDAVEVEICMTGLNTMTLCGFEA